MPTLKWDQQESAKENLKKVPYQLLKHQATYGEHNTNGNLLIQGDNLTALKALLPFYAGRVKCIFIDPPYNTGSAFTHYDDKLEHNIWLSMMYPRLKLLHQLLAEDGSLWVTIDDNEAHYLKVLIDEMFARENFVCNVLWQKRTSTDNRLRLGGAHDHILVYKKNKFLKENFNQLAVNLERAKDFKNPDDDPRGAWASTDFTGMTGHATPSQFYTVISPNGKAHPPPNGRCWALAESTFLKLIADNRVWFGKDGKARPRLKRYLSEMEGQNSWSWWANNEVGHNQEAKKEINELFGADNAFDTPKPERLLQRVLNIATNKGDLVLDSFLGSGTTAAVAQKMGRRWIAIETGEHAVTHCIPRLQKVIEGEQGGISQSEGWQGSGGFDFFTLGETIFLDNGHINPKVNFKDLAAYIWQTETKQFDLVKPQRLTKDEKQNNPTEHKAATPLLGVHNGTAYYLLYNGILKDRRPEGGNVLTSAVWAWLKTLSNHTGNSVVFGDACLIYQSQREKLSIVFKQMPYKLAKI